MGNNIKAADLHRVLSDVQPFVSTDSLIPAICAIRVETDTVGNLVAMATDRFTLGMSRADYSGEMIAITLVAADANKLIRMAKTARRDAAHREVEIVAVAADTLEWRFSSGESLTTVTSTADFPACRKLIPADHTSGHESEQHDAVAYNPANLAKFAKVAGSGEMVLHSRGRSKPAVVTIGSDFVGMIMCLRADNYAYVTPAWAAN